MIEQKNKQIIIFAVIVVLLAGSIVYWTSYEIKQARQDYESRIAALDRQASENMQALRETLSELGVNLSAQIGIVDTSLQNFKNQNKQDIRTLSELIDQIEKQSSIRLNELKEDVKSIRIKSADFSAVVDEVLDSVVSVGTNVGQGSGVIASEQGYIVTNVHVINGASVIRITTYSGDTYYVKAIAGYDIKADIAVLKIDASGLKALKFGDSDSLKVGEKVIASGNPAGLSFTVTEGIVSALRTINDIRYIQTDVPINPGNSGGPLVNAKGEVVGISNFKVSGYEGLGFAIASSEVSAIVSRIIEDYEAAQNQ